ncbi:hypothetical protein BH11PAT3_BH11PAT3_0320 [soil metagenome]
MSEKNPGQVPSEPVMNPNVYDGGTKAEIPLDFMLADLEVKTPEELRELKKRSFESFEKAGPAIKADYASTLNDFIEEVEAAEFKYNHNLRSSPETTAETNQETLQSELQPEKKLNKKEEKVILGIEELLHMDLISMSDQEKKTYLADLETNLRWPHLKEHPDLQEKLTARKLSANIAIEPEESATKGEVPSPEVEKPVEVAPILNPEPLAKGEEIPTAAKDNQKVSSQMSQAEKDVLKAFFNAFGPGKNEKSTEREDEIFEYLPESETREVNEVKKEFEAMPEEEKEAIKIGLGNIGFAVDEKKNNFFAGVFNQASKIGNEKGTVARFAGALRDSFVRDAESAHSKSVDVTKGNKKNVGNTLSLFGNVLKYGRIVSDVTGKSLASPLRYVMMAGASVARVADAGKEARLQNEEVIEKTRIADVEKAEEEAWAIFEQSKKGNEDKPVNAKDLQKVYMDRMPADLLERLGRDSVGESNIANRIVQSVVKNDIEGAVMRLNKKIEKIESDTELTEADKETKKQKLLNDQKANLLDYDRIITQYGTVDTLAMAARYSKVAGKTAVTAVSVETLALSVEHLWENLSRVLTHTETHAAIAGVGMGSAHHLGSAPKLDTLHNTDSTPTHSDSTHSDGAMNAHEATDTAQPSEEVKVDHYADPNDIEKHAPRPDMIEETTTTTTTEFSGHATEDQIRTIEAQLGSHTPLVELTPSHEGLEVQDSTTLDDLLGEKPEDANFAERMYQGVDPEHTKVVDLYQDMADASKTGAKVTTGLVIDKLHPTGDEMNMTVKDFLEHRFPGQTHDAIHQATESHANTLIHEVIKEHATKVATKLPSPETISNPIVDSTIQEHAGNIETGIDADDQSIDGDIQENAGNIEAGIDEENTDLTDAMHENAGDIAANYEHPTSEVAQAAQSIQKPSFWDNLMNDESTHLTTADKVGLGIAGGLTGFLGFKGIKKFFGNKKEIESPADFKKLNDEEKVAYAKELKPIDRIKAAVSVMSENELPKEKRSFTNEESKEIQKLFNAAKFKPAAEKLENMWKMSPKESSRRKGIKTVAKLMSTFENFGDQGPAIELNRNIATLKKDGYESPSQTNTTEPAAN